jgi:hypothetical protein
MPDMCERRPANVHRSSWRWTRWAWTRRESSMRLDTPSEHGMSPVHVGPMFSARGAEGLRVER